MEERIVNKTSAGKSVIFRSILPQTRSGKSILVGSIFVKALSRGMPIVALDYPEIDSTTMFSDYSEVSGSLQLPQQR